MSERTDLFCGCAYIQPGGKGGMWYQVIACPYHDMDMAPLAEVPNRKPGHS